MEPGWFDGGLCTGIYLSFAVVTALACAAAGCQGPKLVRLALGWPWYLYVALTGK